jgi:hypothetical protein
MSVAVKESYFWQQVKAGLDDAGTHLSRIENTAGTGISDVSACCLGREAWIELKVFHGKRLHFRNSQRVWITRRVAAGGRVLVLARRDDDAVLYRALDVVLSACKVESDGKSFSIDASDLPTPIFSCHKPFKWSELRSAIFELPT